MKSKKPRIITSKRTVLMLSDTDRGKSTPKVRYHQGKEFRTHLEGLNENIIKGDENTRHTTNCKPEEYRQKRLICLTETDQIPPLNHSSKSIKRVIFQKTNSASIKKSLESPYTNFYNDSLLIKKSVSDKQQIDLSSQFYNTLNSFRIPYQTPKRTDNTLKTFLHSTKKSNEYFTDKYDSRKCSTIRKSRFPDLTTYMINKNELKKQNTIEILTFQTKRSVKSDPSFVVRLSDRFKVVDTLKIKKIQYSKKDYDKNMIKNKLISEKLLIGKGNICHKLKLDKFKYDKCN